MSLYTQSYNGSRQTSDSWDFTEYPAPINMYRPCRWSLYRYQVRKHPKEGLLEVHLGDFDSIRSKNRITNMTGVQFTYLLPCLLNQAPKATQSCPNDMLVEYLLTMLYIDMKILQAMLTPMYSLQQNTMMNLYMLLTTYVYPGCIQTPMWTYIITQLKATDEEYKSIFGNMVGYTASTECHHCIRLGVGSASPNIQCPPKTFTGLCLTTKPAHPNILYHGEVSNSLYRIERIQNEIKATFKRGTIYIPIWSKRRKWLVVDNE